jgi:hypothetical protein
LSIDENTNARSIKELSDLISAFVEEIEIDCFQARYRGAIVGEPINSWSSRLEAYFWPTPDNDLDKSSQIVEALSYEGTEIANSIQNPSDAILEKAKLFAEKVFKWGGVQQKPFNGQVVLDVIRVALSCEPGDAPMNSGWTKVAAFSTYHLDKQGRSQSIWDSRFSNSLLRRFDKLLFSSSHKTLPAWLPKIGTVPGRGGTRLEPFRGNFHWPSGYRSWQAHFAASDILRRIASKLNEGTLRPLGIRTSKNSWSIREVEMVLFMDGY